MSSLVGSCTWPAGRPATLDTVCLAWSTQQPVGLHCKGMSWQRLSCAGEQQGAQLHWGASLPARCKRLNTSWRLILRPISWRKFFVHEAARKHLSCEGVHRLQQAHLELAGRATVWASSGWAALFELASGQLSCAPLHFYNTKRARINAPKTKVATIPEPAQHMVAGRSRLGGGASNANAGSYSWAAKKGGFGGPLGCN